MEGATFSQGGKLWSSEFDWRKKGNAKIPSWDNTILGNIKIAGRSLIAEVNSENRAKLLRQEVEKRLGASATHQSTSVKTVDEMLAKALKRTRAQAKEDTEFEQALLRDPKAKSQLQQMIQKQTEDWVQQKVPLLGGRTPLQAFRNPDGKEIVEALFWTGNVALTTACTRPESDPTSTPSANC